MVPRRRMPSYRPCIPRSGLSRTDFVLWHTAVDFRVAAIRSGYRGTLTLAAVNPELGRSSSGQASRRERATIAGHKPLIALLVVQLRKEEVFPGVRLGLEAADTVEEIGQLR